MISSGVLRRNFSTRCHLDWSEIKESWMSPSRIWHSPFTIDFMSFLLGMVGGTEYSRKVGSSCCFLSTVKCQGIMINIYRLNIWDHGCKIRSTMIELHDTPPKCKQTSHPWIIWDRFFICFLLALQKNDVEIHIQRLHAHEMRNPPKKDLKIWSAGLVQEMYLKQKTS